MIKKIINSFNKALTYILVGIIKFYKVAISPYTARSCRYTPSCSEYSIEALKIHGPFIGGFLAIKRIISCNPWGGKGYDHVPCKSCNKEEKNT